MANFDMVPPDANEVFGFNQPSGENIGKINWKLISVVLIVITMCFLIGKKTGRKFQNQEESDFS